MSPLFEEAIRRFDAINGSDPNLELVAGTAHPRELLYSLRLTGWVLRLQPDASEPLRLAARCQHLARWEIPRERYPKTRAGYHQWRNQLKEFHAERAGAVLRDVGYPEPLVARVQALNRKQGFPEDPETRVIEDGLCLVFLEHQLAELAGRTSEEKLTRAIGKSWEKMTPAAQTAAGQLPLDPASRLLIEKALASRE
jgi:hypothetical protein